MKKGPEPHRTSTKEIPGMDVKLFSHPYSSQAHTSQKSWVGELACWGLVAHRTISSGRCGCSVVLLGSPQAAVLQIPGLTGIT